MKYMCTKGGWINVCSTNAYESAEGIPWVHAMDGTNRLGLQGGLSKVPSAHRFSLSREQSACRSALHHSLHAFPNDSTHHIEVFVLKLHGQPAVNCAFNDPLRLPTVLGHGPVGPVAEVPCVFLGPKDAQLDTMGIRLLQECSDLRLSHINEVELDGVTHSPHLWELLGDDNVRRVVQLRLNLLIPAGGDKDTLLKRENLRADDGRSELGHAQGVVGGNLLGLDGLEDFVGRAQGVLLVELLVRACVNDHQGSQTVIIGEGKPSFSGVEHLVGLRADACDFTMVACVHAVPQDTKAVGAILDHAHLVLEAQGDDGIHVGHLPPHVGDN
mmetsp:Transcript_145752/g.254431  ORF Transcript_145752/g.254431 Transcript_145752/m.254431 type:complete len:328 (+) Transcript_145752:1524-2507(+)